MKHFIRTINIIVFIYCSHDGEHKDTHTHVKCRNLRPELLLFSHDDLHSRTFAFNLSFNSVSSYRCRKSSASHNKREQRTKMRAHPTSPDFPRVRSHFHTRNIFSRILDMNRTWHVPHIPIPNVIYTISHICLYDE